jgi:ATP-dependent Clp protease protease subunit
MGGAQGQASDIEIAAREILRLQDVLRSIMVKHTGQTVEKITHDTDRDFYMSADAAMEYGIVDEILKGAAVEEKPAEEKGSEKKAA